MRKPASISSRLKPIVAVILFFSFVLSSTNISGIVSEMTGLTISQSAHKFSKPASQIPFEENEKELEKTEEEKKSDFLLSYLIKATSLLCVVELKTYHSSRDSGNEPVSQHVPIYLSKRSLLI